MINGTLIQFFHWYIPADGSLWNQLKEQSDYLASLGITAVWLPPAHKGVAGAKASGYDSYDIYDLGEFDQQGSVRTKYGTKEELTDAVNVAKEKGLQIYVDVVVNHMGGAVKKERIKVRRVNPENRNEFISDGFEIDAYTRFVFPGRKGKYSRFKWDHTCFTGVDYAADLNETAIFSIQNEYGDLWEDVIDDEKGNFDYLMYCDIEFRNPAVRAEFKKWIKWFHRVVPFDGMRLDAVKHVAPQFYNEWLDEVRATIDPNMFAVGEYWAPGNLPLLLKYLDAVNNRMSLFDASLHHNLYAASGAGNYYDLTRIFDNTLVQARPLQAVTVVGNHDTQPLQALEAPVQAWFKSIAYALILLRESGYPCVFYPDLYGAHYRDKGRDGNVHEVWLERCPDLEALLLARKQFAYGTQRDYFDFPHCIGWTRAGDGDHPHSGCAVVITNSVEGWKTMEMGKSFAGKVFVDWLKKYDKEITVDEAGWGTFYAKPGSVCVWVLKENITNQ